MPTSLTRRAFVPIMLGALALSLTLVGFAEAKSTKTVPASLRVVDSDGKTLAESTQFTTTAKVKADPAASCFGPGSTSSSHTVPGPTALGQLAYASKLTKSLRPVSITDAQSFGLGVCAIAGAVAPPTGFWYLVHNNAGAQVGAEQLELRKGDSVLWYLISDFMAPTPDELVLKAAKPKNGQVAVTVRSIGADGSKSAAADASVSGAAEPTDSNGRTTVTLEERITDIQATRDGSIPSNVIPVCAEAPKKCPLGYAATIGGTSKPDKIKGSSAAETILAGAGNDKVRVPKGSAGVKVNCGPGKDVLRIAKSRKAKIKSCEKVRRTK